MADLKQELAQIQGRLAALKKDCLAKMGEHGGDAVINAGSAVARKLKARARPASSAATSARR